MIFVTVGTELPFDRLVRAIDGWAQAHGRNDVFAQIGETDYRPAHIGYAQFLEAPDFARRFKQADLVISHAGMGTILTALSRGQRLLVMPRRAALGEHRNEHQLATARYLLQQGRIEVAFDEQELRQRLDTLDQLQPKELISDVASPELIATLQDFIANARQPRPARRQALSKPARPAPALDSAAARGGR